MRCAFLHHIIASSYAQPCCTVRVSPPPHHRTTRHRGPSARARKLDTGTHLRSGSALRNHNTSPQWHLHAPPHTFLQLHAAPCAAAAASMARRSTPASSAISWCVRTTRCLSKSSRSPAPPAPPAGAVALAPPPPAPAGVLAAALSYSASPLSISSYTWRRELASRAARFQVVPLAVVRWMRQKGVWGGRPWRKSLARASPGAQRMDPDSGRRSRSRGISGTLAGV